MREAYDRVTGREIYLGDLRIPGMAWAMLLISPSSGGQISPDAFAAVRAVPGVLSALPAADIREAGLLPPPPDTHPLPHKAQMLTDGGTDSEPLGIIVAIDDATARAAGRLLQTERRSGPPEIDPGWCAAFHPLEAEVALASAEPDGTTVWSGDPDPFGLRQDLARAFRLRTNDVRVISVPTGRAGVGSSERIIERLVLYLSQRVRRPVRLETSGRAHPRICHAGLANGESCSSRAAALVRLHRDGSATVLQGVVDGGRGLRTILAQAAAGGLGIDTARVEVSEPDTALVPAAYSLGDEGVERAVLEAVCQAVAQVVERVKMLAAPALGVAPEETEIAAGGVRSGERHLPYPEIIRLHFGIAGGELAVLGHGLSEAASNGPGIPEDAVSVGVELDRETGSWRVSQVAATLDAGLRVNPVLWTLAAEAEIARAIHATRGGLRFRDAPASIGVAAAERQGRLEVFPESRPLFQAAAGAVQRALIGPAAIGSAPLSLTPEALWRLLRRREEEPDMPPSGTGSAEVLR